MSAATGYIPLLWAVVAAAGILAYVLLDGWVLGLGILYPLVARQTDRDLLIASMAPSWAANEPWLVLGAILLLLGFPTLQSILPTQFYLPIFAVWLMLLVRGVSYELRRRWHALRRVWELTFAGSSILAALAQGYIVGRLIEGFGGDVVSSGLIGWLRSLFPIICGLGLLAGYALLGTGWLIFKEDGALRVMGREVSHSALFLTAAVMVVVCLLIPVVSPHMAHRWVDPSMRIILGLFAAAAVVVVWQLWASLWRNADQRPLQWAFAFVILAIAGIAIGLYPYLVPYRFTFHELANDPAFMRFAGVGSYVMSAVAVLYLLIGYRTLRGKPRRAAIPVAASPALAFRKTCGNNVDLHLS